MSRYNKISNTPFIRHRVTMPYCYWDNAFTEDELNDIEKYCDSFNAESAQLLRNQDASLGDVRKSKVYWFERENHLALDNLFNKLNLAIEKINDDYYNYDLNGYSSIQYTTYSGDELGQYDYHIDMSMGSNIDETQLKYGDSRKLSLSLILSDSDSYEGGKFTMQLNKNEHEMAQKRGRILFFPSFILHKVHPVTKGVRKSIVAWVEGPKFR
jgi:PKHD-type hydroxylase